VVSAGTLELPSGARFFACSLQVNPFAYLARHAKQTSYQDEAAYNTAMVAACVANGIEVVGLTDHYRIDTSRTLAEGLRDAGVTVLPGFEAVSKDGVHFLCLFDPQTPENEIERRIGECGVVEGSADSPLGQLDALELLQCCERWGAACIAAHVAAAGGLLKTLSGQSAINTWRSPHLLACSLAGPVRDAPQNVKAILENTNPDYKRTTPVAVINAKDVVDPTDFSGANAATFIKMSNIGLEGLKQAFLDPGSRIRLTSDPEIPERTEFQAIEWTGGFLDGVAIRFNENLNTLIGGPGSGKSTIIESIRYVLDIEPVGEDAKKTHDQIVKQVLRAGTQVSLQLASPHPSKRTYVIERIVPNPPTLKNEDGDLLQLTPAEVAPRVEIYGQHEISEIARSPEERTRLLRRFLDVDEVGAARAAVARKLPGARDKLQTALQRRAEIEEELAALPGLTETLKRYEEAGLEDRLKEKSQLVTEDQLLKQVDGRSQSLEEAINSLARELPLDTSIVEASELEGLPSEAILKKLKPAMDTLSTDLAKTVADSRAALDRFRGSVDGIRAERQSITSRIDADYQKTLRDLQKENVDAEEFIRLRERIERLQPLNTELATVNAAAASAKTERDALIVQLEDAKASEFREFERVAKRVSSSLSGTVRVTVNFQGNREPLITLLRRTPGGRLSEAFDAIRAKPDLSLRAFADACRRGADQLIKDYGISPAQAARIAGGGRTCSWTSRRSSFRTRLNWNSTSQWLVEQNRGKRWTISRQGRRRRLSYFSYSLKQMLRCSSISRKTISTTGS
jgi:hypothetical protein